MRSFAIVIRRAYFEAKMRREYAKNVVGNRSARMTSLWEALEVASGIQPIDLRLTEIAIREVAKINAKSTDHPLKIQLNQCIEQDPGSRFIGPLNLALCQATEMHQITDISISMIQPEPAYNPGDLVRSIRQPDY